VIVRATRDNASESLATIASAPPDEVLPRLAAANAVLMARAGRLIALGESASLMDTGLRAPAREAADSLYAIASESTYLRMTEGAGLAPDRYGRWLADTLAAVLIAHHPAA